MQDQPFFRLSPAGAKLLLDLASPSAAGPLLIISHSGDLAAAAQLEGRVVEASIEHGLTGIVEALTGKGPYSSAIIVPPFSVEVVDAKAPAGWAEERRWMAEEYLIAHAWSQLGPGSRIVALVSAGLLSLVNRRSARQALVDHGLRLVAELPNDVLWMAAHAAGTHLMLLERRDAPAATLTLIDLSSEQRLPPAGAFTCWLNGEPYSAVETHPVTVAQDDLSEDSRLAPAFYDPAYDELRAPPGFHEFRLEDIAAVQAGVRIDRADRLLSAPQGGGVPFVQVRHIRDGMLDENPFWIRPDVARPFESKRARPGDILISVTGTVGKVALIGGTISDGVLFDTSIRRVRITAKDITPESVAEFLRSELGQQQLRRLTSGTVIPHLATTHLKRLRMFLPSVSTPQPTPEVPAVPDVPVAPVALPPDLTQAQALAQALQEQVLVVLRLPDEGGAWRERVANSLKNLASGLVPTPLADVVRQEFPAPLAIAYRRYQMARHNPYEQLERLINLVEACTYFVFHVLVVHYSRADWCARIKLSKEDERALKPKASFENRIRFIRALSEAARQSPLDIFMPEIIDCGIADDADSFRESLRNPVAHSAPGSEAYVRRLVERHRERLDGMLERLRFLRGYPMCRIRNHHFQHQRWHYQCEMYRGEEYDVNIQELPIEDLGEGPRMIAAERDHLVLLAADYDVLDLWPYYQLHFGDATCRESHLCFVKHFTAEPARLYGESVRNGIELDLPGFADYLRSANQKASNPA